MEARYFIQHYNENDKKWIDSFYYNRETGGYEDINELLHDVYKMSFNLGNKSRIVKREKVLTIKETVIG